MCPPPLIVVAGTSILGDALNQLHDLPAPNRIGLDFDYSVWTPNSEIMLCNVPWSNDYKDVAYYENDAALDTYLSTVSGPVVPITKMTYLKPNQPIRINLPFNLASRFNYVRVYNPAQPVNPNETPRAYYYFVNDVQYVAPNTTQLNIQLDVWQSFSRRVQFGNIYVERGHYGIAAYDADHPLGAKTPEGFDLGDEYRITHTAKHELATTTNLGVLIQSTTSLFTDPGTVTNPDLVSAGGDLYLYLPNATNIAYFDTVLDASMFMGYISNKPWVAQGIISITAVPKPSNSDIQWRQYDDYNGPWSNTKPSTRAIGRFAGGQGSATEKYSVTLQERFLDVLNPDTNGRYRHLKKFKFFPYSFIEITTFSGNPLIVKPETVTTLNLVVDIVNYPVQPNPRVTVTPVGVNGPAGTINDRAGAEWLDMSTGIFDLPQFPIVNNAYLGYMAANAGGLSYQQASADWSNQRAIMGAQLAYDQSTAGIGHSQEQRGISSRNMSHQTAMQNQLASDTAALNAFSSVASGAIGGAVAGPAGAAGGALAGAAGSVTGALSTTMQNQARSASTARSIQASGESGVSSDQYTRGIRDTNADYAAFAGAGDYANNIAAINAKVQDAKLLQPAVAGQFGGDALNLAYHGWAVYARFKTVSAAVQRAIGEYWLRYGYAVNRFTVMPAKYQVMDRFTYWKLSESYIRSSECPELFKQVLRGIFEKGVTVWNDADDIGVIDISHNNPLGEF